MRGTDCGRGIRQSQDGAGGAVIASAVLLIGQDLQDGVQAFHLQIGQRAEMIVAAAVWMDQPHQLPVGVPDFR